MARVETVSCDQCGAIKGAANHWLTMDVEDAAEFDTGDGWKPSVFIGGMQPAHFTRLDICGQMCFYKKLGVLLFGETATGPAVDRSPEPRAVAYDS